MPKMNLYNADCMNPTNGLSSFPNKYFELAIVDPPYGIGHDAKAMNGRKSSSPKYKDYQGKQFKGFGWDDEPMPLEYFTELERVSKNQIIWGANHFIENIPDANSPCWIVWYKHGQNPNSTSADCELAWASFKTAVRYFYYDWCGFGVVNSGEEKIHPTQKPIALYKWLLTKYAKPNDKILDTHLGSGSIAIACYDLGFDLTGFEIDKDYFEAMTKRFEKHKQQLTLTL
jgi:site-specific DNA-methyltransferase (adenine-specific)